VPFASQRYLPANSPAADGGRYKTDCPSNGFLFVAAEEGDDFAAQLAHSF